MFSATRLVLGLLCAMAMGANFADANEMENPVYQRQRGSYGAGAYAGPAMGYAGGPNFPGRGRRGWNRYGQFPGVWFAGSWYARPYPYHFDYYRNLYSGQPNQQLPADCPCAEPAIQQSPALPE